jgi:PKD repeat protein
VTIGQQFSWNINITGGTPPYKVTVNWGDGSQSSYSFNSDPTFTINHDYPKAGNYIIVVSVRDFTGKKTLLQLVAIIHSPIIGPAATGTVGPTSVSSSVSKAIRHYAWVAWPSYVIIVALVFSFWLGEHEEIRILARHKRPTHR